MAYLLNDVETGNCNRRPTVCPRRRRQRSSLISGNRDHLRKRLPRSSAFLPRANFGWSSAPRQTVIFIPRSLFDIVKGSRETAALAFLIRGFSVATEESHFCRLCKTRDLGEEPYAVIIHFIKLERGREGERKKIMDDVTCN